MEFQFRIDDSNFATFELSLSSNRPTSPDSGPEVIATVLKNQAQATVTTDQLLDVAAQVLDHLAAPDPQAPSTDDDWREMFRSGKLGDSSAQD